MGINLGAFIAPLLCGYLGDTKNPGDFRWGFMAACVGMILSLILFITLKNKYIVTPTGEQIGEKPNSSRQDTNTESIPMSPTRLISTLVILVGTFAAFFNYFDLGLIGSFIFSLTISAPYFIITDPALSKVEKQRIWVVYIAAFFVIFFWAAFEQAGASLTYFAEEQTNRTVMGMNVPASYFQSVNAVAIVIFAPLFVWLWGWLGNKGMEPASPFKQSIGLFLLAIGYLVIAFGVKGLDPSAKVSMVWLLGLYTIHTFGELCLSPIGLSMVNKLAPVKLASLLMGVWFLSTAAANKFAGTLSSLYPEEVKIEKSYIPEASPALIKTLEGNMLDTNVWKADPKSTYKLNVAKYATVKVDKNDSLTSLTIDSTSKTAEISVFHLKVIKSNNNNIDRAVLLSDTSLLTHEIAEVKNAKTGKFDKVEKLQFWNLKPVKPSFAGTKIETLYDFFMLFVYMAGIAAVILFFLSSKLLKMMNGVR
jgi:POT family proton-dependent oligopeptide transporter